MNRQLRRALATLVALTPSNALRVALYRRLFGYKVGKGTRIGFLTMIDVRSLDCGAGVWIGGNNRFRGDLDLAIGDGARIISGNRIVTELNRANERTKGYQGRVSIGRRCLVNGGHLIDGTGSFVMEDDAWLAGVGSQVWTHGLQTPNHDVTIGAGAYVGSAARIAPGVTIAEGCVVGLASVVLKPINEPHSLANGNPAAVLKVMTAKERDRRYTNDFTTW